MGFLFAHQDKILTSNPSHSIIYAMRTTVAIDDEVLEQVKEFASARDIPLGRAVTEILRRGISQPAPTHVRNGLQVFSRSADLPLITPELIHKIESEQDLRKRR